MGTGGTQMGTGGELYPEFTVYSASDSWLGVLRGDFPRIRFQDCHGVRAAELGQLRLWAAEHSSSGSSSWTSWSG